MLRSTLHRLRRHLGANVVGYVALFAALGGSASAAAIVTANSQVGPNVIAGAKTPSGDTDNVIAGSIGTPDLAGSSVTGAKLSNNAVTSAKIADGQVGTADLGNGVVTSEKLGQGAVGSANIAPGAVGASALGSDVQVPYTSADIGQSVRVGSLEFTFDCGGTNDSRIDLSAASLESSSEFDVSELRQGSDDSVTPSFDSVTSPIRAGTLIFLPVSTESQFTFVWHDDSSTVTGTLHYLASATSCQASGQLDRVVN